MIKSDVDDLEFQKRGVLVNTNTAAYEDFIKRRAALENKDREIANIQAQINTLNENINLILSILQKQEQGKTE